MKPMGERARVVPLGGHGCGAKDRGHVGITDAADGAADGGDGSAVAGVARSGIAAHGRIYLRCRAMRIDRFLAHHTGRTRKEASGLVRERRVSVDGVVTRDAGAHVDPLTQTVAVDGEPVRWSARQVLMLHKPAGVVTATHDPHERTVLDLLPAAARRRLVPVGRLDKDATGLLLLTDDGALVHALTHPRRGVEKIYEVQYEGVLDGAVARFAAGIVLADGTQCRPAHIEITGPGAARVTVHEGRYHQVKRMIAACGGGVTALHRAVVGGVALDPALAPGEVRALSEDEIARLGVGGASGDGDEA